ncbi:MAG: DUF5060 domain-containing protein [Acidobacteriaceae bacterium]|nr:DUF5060 domain-containing protein [Acidobacteriaceae bacterium]
MHVKGPLLLGLITCHAIFAAEAPSCSQEARSFLPCELQFDWKSGELPDNASPYKDELLNVEFRSPEHTTLLKQAFWTGGRSLSVRFSPTLAGQWTYHVTSKIKRYDDQEGTFNVADSGLPGLVTVANLRHWWTTNKQPHLWLSADVPWLKLDQATYESWLEARKRDGFTHIRGILLTNSANLKPIGADGIPNLTYFSELDRKLLAADARGFTLDLILADKSFVATAALNDFSRRGPLLRYVVARYGGLNITWQGIERFEEIPNARALLKNVNEDLKNYDTYQHPRSTDARNSSSPLIADGWMNYIVEGYPTPEFGAVEHQFTTIPSVHIMRATTTDDFRHELWNLTANAEYPSARFEALENESNRKAAGIWHKVVSDTRYWEFEPYFDVDGARASGLDEVEYLAYAQTPGIVEITLPKHKYNPVWVNPSTGEEIPLKNYRGEVFSRQTPDATHDWVLQVPREGLKENMLKFVRFAIADPPIQEPELTPSKIPFELVDPPGDDLNPAIPVPYSVKVTRAVRATRQMQYIWWGEVVAGGEGARMLAVGPSGTMHIPPALQGHAGANLNVRLLAINAIGKAYEVDRVYRMTQ